MAEGGGAVAAANSPGSPETVRPIVSVDKDTGIIAVNSKWTCSKCSYAYNSMEAHACEVIHATALQGDMK